VTITRLSRALFTLAILMPTALGAQEQEHQTAPAKIAPAEAAAAPQPPVKSTPKETVGVTPTATAAQVAAALAEALRTAEAAQAKRQPATQRPASPRKPVATTPQRRYELNWLVERTVVQWTAPPSDRVRVAWPEAVTANNRTVEPAIVDQP
jgi:hypothetical protein